MAWQLYKRADREDLIEFLSKEEWGHVGFSSRLKEAKESVSSDTIYIRRSPSNDRRICEALLYTKSGLLIPVLSRTETLLGPELSQMLFRKREKRRLHTIMGLRKDVESAQRSIESAGRASIIYYVMTLETPPPLIPSRSRVVCKRGKSQDAGMLYPLQKAYEIEEVLLDPNTFNSGACYSSLQKNLRREIIYYALIDGQVVAKAGTNARGFSFAQLGGVYTVTDVRNRGIAEQVLSVLLQELFEEGTGASLFVKKDNIAAIALYRKLGFTLRDEFKIAYY